MIFTKDQDSAITSINRWGEGTEKIFVLSGYAGTGKTTLIKKFIDDKVKDGVKVSISAPNHKAKKVISRIIYRDAVTLHSLLGLRMGVQLSEFNPHNPIFQQEKNKSTFHLYELVVIDEASMIKSYFFDLIWYTIENTKVRFMGDPAQLPPVNEDNPPVFSLDVDNFKLEKIIRQIDSNALLDVFTDVRKVLSLDLDPQDFKESTILHENKGR